MLQCQLTDLPSASATGGEFTFTLDSVLPTDSYAFRIVNNDSGEFNFSEMFDYEGSDEVVTTTEATTTEMTSTTETAETTSTSEAESTTTTEEETTTTTSSEESTTTTSTSISTTPSPESTTTTEGKSKHCPLLLPHMR